MNDHEDLVLSVAAMVQDAAAMNSAALAGDFDEARFRARLITAEADALGYAGVAIAAAHLTGMLGPAGTSPASGYGAGMLRVANELDAIGFAPL